MIVSVCLVFTILLGKIGAVSSEEYQDAIAKNNSNSQMSEMRNIVVLAPFLSLIRRLGLLIQGLLISG